MQQTWSERLSPGTHTNLCQDLSLGVVLNFCQPMGSWGQYWSSPEWRFLFTCSRLDISIVPNVTLSSIFYYVFCAPVKHIPCNVYNNLRWDMNHWQVHGEDRYCTSGFQVPFEKLMETSVSHCWTKDNTWLFVRLKMIKYRYIPISASSFMTMENISTWTWTCSCHSIWDVH